MEFVDQAIEATDNYTTTKLDGIEALWRKEDRFRNTSYECKLLNINSSASLVPEVTVGFVGPALKPSTSSKKSRSMAIRFIQNNTPITCLKFKFKSI